MRPMLTINKMPQHIRQVTNDIRQNRPSIRYRPADDKADPEVADILMGLVRHIETHSDADYRDRRLYDMSFDVFKNRDELTLYSYKTDPLTNLVMPVLADKDNHVIDALRYACESVRRASRVRERKPLKTIPEGSGSWMNG